MTVRVSKAFWEKHADAYQTAFEKLPELADYVHRSERRHLFRVLPVRPDMTVLDLGCGTGRWAIEFAPRCKSVVAVDFAEGMIRRARQEAERKRLNNIEFVVGSVENFQSDRRFDLIILSGVLVYFQDEDLPPLLQRLHAMLNAQGLIFSRETVGIHRRIDMRTEYHDKIGDAYSAIYRRDEEYIRLFEAAGFRLRYRHDFTPMNIPMIFYRRLVPDRWKDARWVRRGLQVGLAFQYLIDPILLRLPLLYRPILHRFWQLKSMLFLYEKIESEAGAHGVHR